MFDSFCTIFALLASALQSVIELQNIMAHLTFKTFAKNVWSYLRLCHVEMFALLKANIFKITLKELQISQITKLQKQLMIWSGFISNMKTHNFLC